MSSRYSAARPKRAGEEYVRNHQYDDDEDGPSKKPRFDIRNPSALAPDAREDDAVLDADVIGTGRATKRGAVNLEGYESDSDNEGFDARAEERGRSKKGEANLFDELDSYGPNGGSKSTAAVDDDDDADMFAELEEDFGEEKRVGDVKTGKKKAVSFLGEDEIEGQVASSKSGGHISADFRLDPKGKQVSRGDDRESSDDEEDAALAAEEEGIDEEVGAGGLKRNAPKVDAFNMKAEQEEGRFDEAGNFVRKAADPDAKHDMWLEGVSKKEMKRAAAAHEKREEERRKKELADDEILVSDSLRSLILRLERGETVLEALARLGKGQSRTKKVPKWKLKKQKQNGDGGAEMDVDNQGARDDPQQGKIKEAVDAITGAADHLLTKGQPEIYEQERELLIRQYQRETGEQWVEPPAEAEASDDAVDGVRPVKMWEFRWTDGRDGGQKQGPYDGPTMVAWRDAGYFAEGVEFRREGDEGAWSRVVEFI